MMDVTIQTSKLTKQYKGTLNPALQDLNLTIHQAEVYGFLGANGAGKSTAIRTLLNFIQPTGGSATILGLDIVKNSVKVKRHVGYLAGDVALYDNMTGHDFLDYMESLQPPKNKKYRHQLVERFEVDRMKRIGDLSKGNRQKLGIVQAFMHQPEVLILDEPTSGLDPLMQERFYELIAEVKAAGSTVFFSSHNLSEVQRICDRVGFIRNGKLAAEHPIKELHNTSKQSFVIRFDGEVPLPALKKVAGLKVSPLGLQTVRVVASGQLNGLLGVIAKSHVLELTSEDTAIESEFMQLYAPKELKRGGS